ncbi:MAG: division/cell wall cluster transcriptional repressor MraZ [Clostridiales bacterium]|nr:division/cell wall cluster transcriptional repressor MraZ [Candidatus Equinaster intestinalis]
MLYGGYEHTIDKKGRVFIPAKFRDDLGESFIICRSISGKQCLCIYPFSQWEKLVAKLSALPMSQSSGIKRFIFDGSFNVEFDSQGRIVIPPSLRDFASLEGNAHLIGMVEYIELWSSQRWQEENNYNEIQAAEDAEKFAL